MLSTLGFDSKGPSRNTRNDSKYVLEVPRGFSVHLFKSPSPPAGYPQNGSTKQGYVQNRPQPTLPWKASSNVYPPRPDPPRKPSLGWNQNPDYERPGELERSKSRKTYAIYPGTVPDMYIYEPSITSTTDLPGSPSSSSSSSDSEAADTASAFAVEVSSTRASSSTETLEATAFAVTNKDAATRGPSPYGQAPRTSPTRPVIPPGITVPSINSARYPIVDAVGGSDDGTVVDEYESSRAERGLNGTSIVHTPVRRNSDDHSPKGVQGPRLEPSMSRRGSQSASRSTSSTSTLYGAEGDPALHLPPGLQYATPIPASVPQGTRAPAHRATISLPATQRPTLVSDAAVSRALSAPEVPTLASTNAKRGVRWTEELVCPSPIPVGQRRRGWYNRRGDQLWTNDGRYKSPEPGQEYPHDLTCYPEPNTGWMNEDGTRIDMQHRLIPKPPLRSALKRPKSTQPEQIMINTPTAP